MTTPLIQCPKCKAGLLEGIFNQPEPTPCPSCAEPLQIEIYPAFFRRQGPAQASETIMIEGESSCFYHPQKKAVLPCDACGRFLCALCDCEIKGQHLCPGCLQSGQKKQTIRGMEDSRTLYRQQAFALSVIPFVITGIAAVFLALRYWKTPGSLVRPMNWAMPAALVLGGLQVLFVVVMIVLAFIH